MRVWYDLIRQAAEAHKLDPALVAAIVEQESAGDPHATRFESRYIWLFPPHADLSYEEVKGQKTSWGLMQCMGAVLRELGYQGPLEEILEHPDVQLELGCRFFARLMVRCVGVVEAALSTWNTGQPYTASGKRYAEQVLARVERLRVDMARADLDETAGRG